MDHHGPAGWLSLCERGRFEMSEKRDRAVQRIATRRRRAQADHRRDPFRQCRRGKGAGVLRRRHYRGHHHGARAFPLVLRDREEFELRLQRTSPSTPSRSRVNSACNICWKEACANPVRPFASRRDLVDATTGAQIWAERYDLASDGSLRNSGRDCRAGRRRNRARTAQDGIESGGGKTHRQHDCLGSRPTGNLALSSSHAAHPLPGARALPGSLPARSAASRSPHLARARQQRGDLIRVVR